METVKSKHYIRAYQKEWSRVGNDSRHRDVGYCAGFYVTLYCDAVNGSKTLAWFSDVVDAIAFGQVKAHCLCVDFHQDIPVKETKKKKRGKK